LVAGGRPATNSPMTEHHRLDGGYMFPDQVSVDESNDHDEADDRQQNDDGYDKCDEISEGLHGSGSFLA
jgi:hypothetical protein